MQALRCATITTLMSVALALASTSTALADGPEDGDATSLGSMTRLSPGLMYSMGGGDTFQMGIGASLRLDHYPTRWPIHMGGFVTGEIQTEGSVRVAGGLSGGLSLMACEIGLAYRTDTGIYASSLGLHIGKTITFGPFSIGGRLTIPLIDFVPDVQTGGNTRVQGIEGAVVLTFALPTTIDGQERPDCGCPHREDPGHEETEHDD